MPPEPGIQINGVWLNDAQAGAVRVACLMFLSTNGMLAEFSSGHQDRLTEVVALMQQPWRGR